MKRLFCSLLMPALFLVPSFAQTFRVVHEFAGPPDGSSPSSVLVDGAQHNLYGATADGGKMQHGTIYTLSPSGTEQIVYTFGWPPDGVQPVGNLVRDTGGNIYGVTVSGGAHDYGTVFKVGQIGKETVLYSFAGGSDGFSPQGGVVLDARGNIYGTTVYGGHCGAMDVGCGTIFKLTSEGKKKTLYAFSGGPDGSMPVDLVQDTAGNLYGTTLAGGSSGGGVVFEFTASGSLKVLHGFQGGSDGAGPSGALTLGANGSLYGTTASGGLGGHGTVFEINRNGEETILYSFCDCSTEAGVDGSVPVSGVV